jgi:hypothetical protein
MVDKDFLDYIDKALKQYEEYKKLENKGDFSFRDFLLIILVWKVEAIYELLEEGNIK